MTDHTIYLVRHGETEWNVAGRFQGRGDSALTERGRFQAHQVGQILAAEITDPAAYDICASPLGRTRATADIALAFAGRAYRLEEEIAEIDVGSWSGQTFEDVAAGYPEIVAGCTRRDFQFHAPDGESLAVAQARASRWLSSVSRPTLAVTHGTIGRLIRAAYLGLDSLAALDLDQSQGVVVRLSGGREDILTMPERTTAKAG